MQVSNNSFVKNSIINILLNGLFIPGLQKHSKGMSTVLRRLASSETDAQLQNLIFFCSNKYERIEKEQAKFGLYEAKALSFIEETKKLIVDPYRVRKNLNHSLRIYEM